MQINIQPGNNDATYMWRESGDVPDSKFDVPNVIENLWKKWMNNKEILVSKLIADN